MNVYSKRGDGIITPDIHVAKFDSSHGGFQIAIVEPGAHDVPAYLTEGEAKLLAESILKILSL